MSTCTQLDLETLGSRLILPQKLLSPTPHVILRVLHRTRQVLYVKGYLNHTRSVKVHIDLKKNETVLLTAFYIHKRSLRFDRGDKLSCCIGSMCHPFLVVWE